MHFILQFIIDLTIILASIILLFYFTIKIKRTCSHCCICVKCFFECSYSINYVCSMFDRWLSVMTSVVDDSIAALCVYTKNISQAISQPPPPHTHAHTNTHQHTPTQASSPWSCGPGTFTIVHTQAAIKNSAHVPSTYWYVSIDDTQSRTHNG